MTPVSLEYFAKIKYLCGGHFFIESASGIGLNHLCGIDADFN